MVDELYFFDSYAIMEIFKGNPSYEKFTDSKVILINQNIFEIYLSILRQFNKNEAENSLEKYYPFIIDFDDDIIRKACEFKNQFFNEKISMTDCIGYIIAKKMGIKFLTGDEKFKTKENVEFVK